MAADVPTRDGTRYGRLGKYRVLAHIATGGMATVYRGLDPDTGQEVALKVLPRKIVAGKPALLERFRREAALGARLRHENIVALYEFGEATDTFFLAMELVDGPNLQQHVEKAGPLTPGDARRVLIQIARALEHAHANGLVHRDIKPANILLAQKDGRTIAKLADLGLAREVDDEEFRITRDGCTVGTVDYMAPEQARDSFAADIRSDIYSLGCTFFQMLTGQPPFGKGTLPERIYQHIGAEPPDVRTFNPQIPPELVDVLKRMLAKKPDDRFQTPTELLAGLSVRSQPARVERSTRTPCPRLPAGTMPSAPALQSKPEPEQQPVPSRRERPVPETGSARVAAGQYDWAKAQLARGNFAYGKELLLNCCRLDPTNLLYHQALRLVLNEHGAARPTNWLGYLGGFVTRLKFKLARRARNHLQVLTRGVELIARKPENIDAPLAMAAAATELGHDALALWLLEEARRQDKTYPPVNRALARYHEGRKEYADAVAYWERVKRAVPEDLEAADKIRNLAALLSLQQHHERQTGTQGNAPGPRP